MVGSFIILFLQMRKLRHTKLIQLALCHQVTNKKKSELEPKFAESQSRCSLPSLPAQPAETSHGGRETAGGWSGPEGSGEERLVDAARHGFLFMLLQGFPLLCSHLCMTGMGKAGG